jgi:hypothetical protein
MDVRYRYVPEKNPHGGALPGVPLKNLTAQDMMAIPRWLHQSIAAQPYFEAVINEVPAEQPRPEQQEPEGAGEQRSRGAGEQGSESTEKLPAEEVSESTEEPPMDEVSESAEEPEPKARRKRKGE